MLHLPIHPDGLLACGREHRLLDDTRSVEQGYLVHALLARLWGDGAPKPFDVQERAVNCPSRDEAARFAHQPISVLAYSAQDVSAAEHQAQRQGDALAFEAINWRRARSKPMPDFAVGQRIGFRVRICPTVRIGKHHPRFQPGAEVDPYVALVERALAEQEIAQPERAAPLLKAAIVAEAPAREAVYRDWLAARLSAAARLDEARLVLMQDARLWRRGESGPGAPGRMHGRTRPAFGTRRAIGRRAAVFEGTLQVNDQDGFTAMLARGVGRHRAFGFGMLLLRPAS